MEPVATGVRPVDASSIADRVTEELRRAILSGSLAPGETFSLRQVAGMLEVSFIPVREALRNLEGEGLVVTRPGRSAMVAPLDLDDLHAIYRLRRQLEPEMARRACRLITDEDLDRLESDAVQFGDESLSMDAIYDNHIAFHLALLAPATSSWDIRILTTLWRAAERYVRIGFGAFDPDPQEHHRRADAHHTLLEGFRSRDPKRASAAVLEHLTRNEEIAKQGLSSRGAEQPERATAT